MKQENTILRTLFRTWPLSGINLGAEVCEAMLKMVIENGGGHWKREREWRVTSDDVSLNKNVYTPRKPSWRVRVSRILIL